MANKTNNCLDCKHINLGTRYEYDKNGVLLKTEDYIECNKYYKRNSSRNTRFPFTSTTCACFEGKDSNKD